MTAKPHWTVDGLPWSELDPAKADPDALQLAKAAALVEYNGELYAEYLCNVFHDDPLFQQAARDWAVEEVQHGEALGRWAAAVDPRWDFAGAVRRFRDGYKIELNRDQSVRGSLSGELIARCIVETGTSSYYAALGQATQEPVFKAICRNIAADELRHYKLFYTHLRRYLEREGLGRLGRLRVALGRIRESEDDELAYAYYAANVDPAVPYDHAVCNRAYMGRAYRYYRADLVDRAVGMVFKAAGLSPQGWLRHAASRAAWRFVDSRAKKLAA
ncbi:MAG TPA: ferritin-like domain-containing protein [Alphaproteobacteria bacterium]|nr:ferritin-like domain-containing protein [Alphaproteobacteria bacterium]